MKRFRVVKSSLDGVCGGDHSMTIEDACQEISYAKGWPSMDKLREAIFFWAETAKPGDIFKTDASVIVAARNRDSPSSFC